MHGYPLGLVIFAVVVLVLGLVALLRCRREDIPEIIHQIGGWWRWWR
jgi:hypothetical protein